MIFQDHFSGHAPQYEAFRPIYPAALFAHLAALAPGRDLAWDCATGNGQAALAIAPYFRSVLATDASPQQIAQARPHASVRYEVAPAERAPLPDAAVDLVTVAQALHWFNRPRFYAEVRRVARPGGILAAWSYGLHAISPEVDAVVHRLYAEILGEYWPPERRWVEEEYKTLWFPFEEVVAPSFPMTERWDFARLLGYLGTWSATQRYQQAKHGADPLDLVRAGLRDAWGDPNREREILWPLYLRIGRVVQGD
jgi:SAM-dependent methyltransferase